MIYKILEDVEKTNSRLEKEKLLKKNKNDLLSEIILYTYDTINRQYNIKKYNTDITSGSYTIETDWERVKNLLDRLSNRELTGNKAIEALETLREKFTHKSSLIIDRIIKRDLGIGCSVSIFNKIYKNLIPTFSVALASSFDSSTEHLVNKGKWFISRKLDGVRCLAINKNGKWKFFSRQGNEYLTLDKVKTDLEKLNISNVVLDGEICLVDEKGLEDFQNIMKEIRKKNHKIENPRFKIFDLIQLEDFEKEESKELFSERLEKLNSIEFGDDFKTLEVLEQKEYTQTLFLEIVDIASDKGWEGLMLRKDDIYKGKRSKDILKVKNFYDNEYTVIGFDTGTISYQEKGRGVVNYEGVTALHIKHKENLVKVGSGLSKEQRLNFIHNPSLIIGKLIKVRYFEETKNKEGGISLRFPTLVWVYENERND